MIINNFFKIEELMKFEPGTFYKFCVIVRNKDGINPLTCSEAPSGEVTIKEWFVGDKGYYEKVKPAMKLLAESTGGRLYVTLDRKNYNKALIKIQQDVTDILNNRLLSKEESYCRRINKIIRSATSIKEVSDRNYGTWLYDIDTKNHVICNAIKIYAQERCNNVWCFDTVNGYHVVTRRTYRIEDNWRDKVFSLIQDMYALNNIKLTAEETTDIIKVLEETKVEPNQLGLVYYKK